MVLDEPLTGHLPFEGSSIYEIMAAVLSEREAPLLSRYSSEIPAELECIVGKALRKNPEERYQTIKDLLIDCRVSGSSWSSGEPTNRADCRGERRPGVLSFSYRDWRHSRLHSPCTARTREKSPLTPSMISVQTKK